jgi:hypothetical protein
VTRDASNRVIGPAPESPFNNRFQVSSTPHAKGVTAPIPVMTTRRILLNPTSFF